MSDKSLSKKAAADWKLIITFIIALAAILYIHQKLVTITTEVILFAAVFVILIGVIIWVIKTIVLDMFNAGARKMPWIAVVLIIGLIAAWVAVDRSIDAAIPSNSPVEADSLLGMMAIIVIAASFLFVNTRQDKTFGGFSFRRKCNDPEDRRGHRDDQSEGLSRLSDMFAHGAQ